MKQKLVTILLAVFLMNVAAHAQEKTRSITIGGSPFGTSKVGIKLDDENYKYHYKSFYNVNLGYERQFKGVIAMTELSYSHASFDKYDLTGHSQWFNETQSEDLTSAGVMFYAGKNVLPTGRFQLPLYIGIGGEYLKGGPLHNLTIDAAVKARVKFYITNNIAVYVGANGKYGYGTKLASEKSASSKKYYHVTSPTFYVDAGLSFGLYK